MLVRKRVVLRKHDCDVTDGARLGGANGGSGSFPDLIHGERLHLTETDDKQAFRLQAAGCVKQERLTQRSFELAGAQHTRGCTGDGRLRW